MEEKSLLISIKIDAIKKLKSPFFEILLNECKNEDEIEIDIPKPIFDLMIQICEDQEFQIETIDILTDLIFYSNKYEIDIIGMKICDHFPIYLQTIVFKHGLNHKLLNTLLEMNQMLIETGWQYGLLYLFCKYILFLSYFNETKKIYNDFKKIKDPLLEDLVWKNLTIHDEARKKAVFKSEIDKPQRQVMAKNKMDELLPKLIAEYIEKAKKQKNEDDIRKNIKFKRFFDPIILEEFNDELIIQSKGKFILMQDQFIVPKFTCQKTYICECPFSANASWEYDCAIVFSCFCDFLMPLECLHCGCRYLCNQTCFDCCRKKNLFPIANLFFYCWYTIFTCRTNERPFFIQIV